MDIDPKIAQTIVANIKDVLKHEINFFDTSGTIIASTDTSRIGTGHGGAKLAVKLNKTIAIDNDHQYVGARNGINVPVVFNGSVVAVVGVTGKSEEVEDFGNVIRKMTEILIRENLDSITRFDRRMMMANLVALLQHDHPDTGLINTLAATLQIDMDTSRRAVVGRVDTARALATLGDRVYETLSRRGHECGTDLFAVTPQEFCFFVDGEERDGLAALVADVEEIAHLDGKVRLVLGMGEVSQTAEEYWRSYDQASTTATWQLFTGASGLAEYADLDYGIYTSRIPTAEAHRFVARVFGQIPEDDVDKFKRLFDAYTEYNGSVTHAATSLFIHKNTLQNKLNAMAAATGYNPRNLKDYAVLDSAFRLRDFLRFTHR